MSIDTLKFALVAAMSIPTLAIPILYHLRQPWWESPYGRAFMVLAVGLALLVNFAVTFRLVPDFPGKDVITLAVYVVLLVAFSWLAVLMARVPRGR